VVSSSNVMIKLSKIPDLVALNVRENKENLMEFLLDSATYLYKFCIYYYVYLSNYPMVLLEGSIMEYII